MKKMNILKNWLLSFLIFMGCSKQLDIVPEKVITELQIVQNADLTAGLLSNAYWQTYIAERGLPYYIGADIASGIDSVSPLNLFNPLWNGSVVPSVEGPGGQQIADYWNNHYAAINTANVIINRVPIEATYDIKLKNQYIAEAKFIRAFNYFALLRYFGDGALIGNLTGDGLPLQLINFQGYTSAKIIPRSSCLEVYNLIIQDLESAASLFDSTININQSELFRGKAQKVTCYALASRVALYQKNYAKVIEYANLCLNTLSTYYSLNESPYNVFPINIGTSTIPIDKEIIFTFPVSYFTFNEQDNSNLQNFYYFKNAVWPSASFIKSYSTNDIRRTQMLTTGVTSTNAIIKSRYCPSKFSNPTNRNNIPIIRLSEVYLNAAEALAQNSQTVNVTAINLLNVIHQRAFPVGSKPASYESSNFINYTALVDTILQERRWELAFEGHDRFDRIRTGKSVNPALDADKRKYVWPIPKKEVDLTNGIIKQNPSY